MSITTERRTFEAKITVQGPNSPRALLVFFGKVAMMAALGAVAQHYIKFPGFAPWWFEYVWATFQCDSDETKRMIGLISWLCMKSCSTYTTDCDARNQFLLQWLGGIHWNIAMLEKRMKFGFFHEFTRNPCQPEWVQWPPLRALMVSLLSSSCLVPWSWPSGLRCSGIFHSGPCDLRVICKLL